LQDRVTQQVFCGTGAGYYKDFKTTAFDYFDARDYCFDFGNISISNSVTIKILSETDIVV
jgi:hypothetical protein